MKRFYILQGVPGSSKSTVAKMLYDSVIGGDGGETASIRSTDALFMDGGIYKFDPSKLGQNHIRNAKLAEQDCIDDVDCIIIDNTNIKQRDASTYIDLAKKYEYSVTVIRVDAGLTEAKKRNATRSEDRKIPEPVIDRMYTEMQNIKIGE